jgi:hypothetical protein
LQAEAAVTEVEMKEAAGTNGTNNGTGEKTKNLPPWLSKVKHGHWHG